MAPKGLYSTDGTLPRLEEMVESAKSGFPQDNVCITVDEAPSQNKCAMSILVSKVSQKLGF